MRRIAVLIALVGLGFAPRAVSAPFDQLSNRLREFDEQTSTTARPQSRNQRVNYQEEIQASPDDYGPPDGIWDEPCDTCDGCGCGWEDGLPTGFWGRAEALYWWVRGSSTPPLLTTDSTTANVPGALDNGTSSILFGGERLNTDGRFGGRFTLGYWFNQCENYGVDTTFFVLGNLQTHYSASSNGSTVLARPFFDTQMQAQNAIVLGLPDFSAGSATINTGRQLLGGDVNLRRVVFANCCRRIEVLAGYRYFHFSESLNITTDNTTVDPVVNFLVGDAFATKNQFNGGQIGINWQAMDGRWTLDVLTKVALGANAQQVSINGATTITVDSSVQNYQGGLLALGSNIGTYHRNYFSVVPELNVNLRYQLTPLWRLNIGYTFLAVTNVVRPGDQVDLRVDTNQIPPPIASGALPAFPFQNSDLWVQGINWGLECRF